MTSESAPRTPYASLDVGGVRVCADRPVVIVPVVAARVKEAAAAAFDAVAAGADVVEWRIDLLAGDPAADPGGGREAGLAAVLRTLPSVVAACSGAPLLITYRTTAEGGSGAASPERYVGLVAAVAAVAGVDLVDVEADHPAAGDAVAAVRGIGGRSTEGPGPGRSIGTDRDAGAGRAAGAGRGAGAGPAVVLSHHDFERTPPREEIVARLAAMEGAGADVAKLAATPRSEEDVLTLLAATAERARVARVPLVTMSMGALGAPSRLVGGRFGSAATFAAAGATSAPGQLPVADVRTVLDVLGRHLPRD